VGEIATCEIVLIGYAGHSYVVIDILVSSGNEIYGYFDKVEKLENPYFLRYLGSELGPAARPILRVRPCFVAIGDNTIRERVFSYLQDKTRLDMSAIDLSALVSPTATIGRGVMCGAHVVVNALASVGDGTILNTGSIVEHECQVGVFAHIGPAATLAGAVTVGRKAFVGANAVVRQGITIGEGAIVGAGAVVVRDVAAYDIVVGNPARPISRK
jgi:sugar O-acyltransferase (sialic acid O-acetyltransferase NeuD family)